MVFSSVSFLFFFLPVVLLLYHGVFFLPVHLGRPSRLCFQLSNALLLAVSVVFYFWGERYMVLLFLATTALDFFAAQLISRGAALQPGGTRTRWQKSVLLVSLVSNVLILLVFKYSALVAASLEPMARAANITLPAFRIALPVGISFFLFHSMSYTIDVYRGVVAPTRNPLDYACYVLMFPQLVAGPIVRFSCVARTLVERSVSLSGFSSGATLFIAGLGKKVLIANAAGEVVDRVYAMPAAQLNAPLAWLAAIAYTIQLYFDFSGYSDMAIGLGRMFGFELPLNFDYPYIARSVRELWRRWHISLSTWFRDYLFIPLGGSRKGGWRTGLNLLVVFLICGLWHGAQWTFAAWGLYHGLFLALERLPAVAGWLERRRAAGHVYTLLVWTCGLVLFRSNTFAEAGAMFRAMAGLGGGAPYPLGWLVRTETLAALLCGAVFSAPLLPWMARRWDASPRWAPVVSVAEFAGLVLVLAASSFRLVSGTHNPFIYFRF